MSVELGNGGRAFGDHDEDSREAAACPHLVVDQHFPKWTLGKFFPYSPC